jgi:hypothetical protein
MSGVRVLLLWVLLSEVQLILAVDDVLMAMTSAWPRVVFISGGVEKEENLGDVIFTKDEVRLLSSRGDAVGARKKTKRKYQQY